MSRRAGVLLHHHEFAKLARAGVTRVATLASLPLVALTTIGGLRRRQTHAPGTDIGTTGRGTGDRARLGRIRRFGRDQRGHHRPPRHRDRHGLRAWDGNSPTGTVVGLLALPSPPSAVALAKILVALSLDVTAGLRARGAGRCRWDRARAPAGRCPPGRRHRGGHRRAPGSQRSACHVGGHGGARIPRRHRGCSGDRGGDQCGRRIRARRLPPLGRSGAVVGARGGDLFPCSSHSRRAAVTGTMLTLEGMVAPAARATDEPHRACSAQAERPRPVRREQGAYRSRPSSPSGSEALVASAPPSALSAAHPQLRRDERE